MSATADSQRPSTGQEAPPPEAEAARGAAASTHEASQPTRGAPWADSDSDGDLSVLPGWSALLSWGQVARARPHNHRVLDLINALAQHPGEQTRTVLRSVNVSAHGELPLHLEISFGRYLPAEADTASGDWSTVHHVAVIVHDHFTSPVDPWHDYRPAWQRGAGGGGADADAWRDAES